MSAVYYENIYRPFTPLCRCDACNKQDLQRNMIIISPLHFCQSCFVKLDKEFKEIEKELQNLENQ